MRKVLVRKLTKWYIVDILALLGMFNYYLHKILLILRIFGSVWSLGIVFIII